MTVSGVPAGAAAKPHVLIIPFPLSGHVIPLLDLTRLLVARGLTATVLATPELILPLLSPLRSAYPSSVEALVLPPPPEAAKDLADAASSVPAAMQALSTLHGPLRDWISGHPNPPSVVIADMFAGWAHRLAGEVGIKSVLFSPSGAMALSVILSLWRTMPAPADSVAFPEIPNSPEYPWPQLSGVYRSCWEDLGLTSAAGNGHVIKEGFLANMESWGVVVNTFHELEGVYVDHLAKIMAHDRVWAVGPLLPPHPEFSGRGGPSLVHVDGLFSWLDSRADGSVVYVCFGSQARLGDCQLAELEAGLEKSGAHFVWVVPKDLVGRTKGFEGHGPSKGLVIRSWAPQVPILNHRAVGVFLTHCGWNSILEGITAGVPMLAWPMRADQFVNATLVVDQLKVARRLSVGPGAMPNSDELARAIGELIGEDPSERARAAELRRAAFEAIGEGGSSDRNFDGMVNKISGLSSNEYIKH